MKHIEDTLRKNKLFKSILKYQKTQKEFETRWFDIFQELYQDVYFLGLKDKVLTVGYKDPLIYAELMLNLDTYLDQINTFFSKSVVVSIRVKYYKGLND